MEHRVKADRTCGATGVRLHMDAAGTISQIRPSGLSAQGTSQHMGRLRDLISALLKAEEHAETIVLIYPPPAGPADLDGTVLMAHARLYERRQTAFRRL